MNGRWLISPIEPGLHLARGRVHRDVDRRRRGRHRATAYTWIARHRLEVVPRRTPRPDRQRLAAMYAQHRSARLVGEELDVSSDTARRWLHDAGVEVTGRSRNAK